MLSKIMKRAHYLAKGFEGNYSAKMALALRQAWSEAKSTSRRVTIELKSNRKSKTWIAAIVGTHPVYKFERKFINPIAWGQFDWDLGNGIYEVCEAGKRYFIRVASGDWRRISESEVA